MFPCIQATDTKQPEWVLQPLLVKSMEVFLSESNKGETLVMLYLVGTFPYKVTL